MNPAADAEVRATKGAPPASRGGRRRSTSSSRCSVSRSSVTIASSWWSTAFYVVLATSIVVPPDVPYVSPVFPAIAEAFSVSSARAGLVITAFAAPVVVSTTVLGVVADRIGRRRVLVPCLALYGPFGVLVAFAGEFTHVLAGVVTGLAGVAPLLVLTRT